MSLDAVTVLEVKIPVSKLKKGMFVCRLDKDWVESSFIFQGFLITSDALIEKLKEECRYVYIDENKGLTHEKSLADIVSAKETEPKKSFLDNLLDHKSKTQTRENAHQLLDIVESTVATKDIIPPPKQASFDEEIEAAELAHVKAGSLIKDVISHVKQGKDIDIIVAKYAVQDCISSILRSPDAMLLLTRLKAKDYSLWQHSLNVSILAISLGRYLNLHDDDLLLLGLCGMFHDIGKLRISSAMLAEAKNKRELKKILDSHTALGRDILQDCMGQLAEVASQVAYCHHEHLDGSGFPRGIKEGQIPVYAQMISIINVYDNLISNKPGEKALSHYQAMSVLLDNAGRFFNPTLVDSFNKCIGTYPVGCIVEMNSGELALVVETNDSHRLRPKIKLLTDSNKEAIAQKIINLADLKFINEADSFFIKAIVDAEDYGIEL